MSSVCNRINMILHTVFTVFVKIKYRLRDYRDTWKDGSLNTKCVIDVFYWNTPIGPQVFPKRNHPKEQLPICETSHRDFRKTGTWNFNSLAFKLSRSYWDRKSSEPLQDLPDGTLFIDCRRTLHCDLMTLGLHLKLKIIRYHWWLKMSDFS